LWAMTKKKSSEILADENRKFFREKVKSLEFFTESENVSKTEGKSETGGEMHHGLREGWTPLRAKWINRPKFSKNAQNPGGTNALLQSPIRI